MSVIRVVLDEPDRGGRKGRQRETLLSGSIHASKTCRLTETHSGVVVETDGLFWTRKRLVPWNQIAEVEYG